jgi:hypothetical protein
MGRVPVADTLNAAKNTIGSAADSITGGYSSVATDFLKDSLTDSASVMPSSSPAMRRSTCLKRVKGTAVGDEFQSLGLGRRSWHE